MDKQTQFTNVVATRWPEHLSLGLGDIRDIISDMDDSQELRPFMDAGNWTFFTQFCVKKYRRLMEKTAEIKFFSKQEVFLTLTQDPLLEDLHFYLGCTNSYTETVLTKFWDERENALELLTLRSDIERLLQHQHRTPTLDSPTVGMVRQALVSAQQTPLNEQIRIGITLLRQYARSLDIESYSDRFAIEWTLRGWVIDLVAYRNEEQLDKSYFFTTHGLSEAVRELKREIFPQLTALGLRVK